VEPAAAELLPLVAALNVTSRASRRTSTAGNAGHPAPVLDFCKQAVAAGCHVEITNLVIPTLNDDLAQMNPGAMDRDEPGDRVPLHLSAYRRSTRRTCAHASDTLLKALPRCREHLAYVYVGTCGRRGQNTPCPACGTHCDALGVPDRAARLRGGACAKCGQHADFVLA